MKLRYLFVILLVSLVTSCQKEPGSTTSSGPTVEDERVVLTGTEDATATFAFTASEAWSANSESSLFTISPTSGEAGRVVMTVTAVDANDTRSRIDMGAITLRYASGGESFISVVQSPSEVVQTLIFYLAGRGNLVSAFERNIVNAMKAIEGNILGESRVILFRQTSSTRSEISELCYDAATGKSVQDILFAFETPLVSTDSATVTRILNEVISLSPAKQYGLIMGSHATGWIPSDIVYLSAPGKIPPVDDYWKKSPEGPQTRSFGLDNNTTMDITALAQSLKDTGVTFEYLIFDACFMSSVEAIYDLRQVTRYVIASPCEVMLYGFPYDQILAPLFVENGTRYDLEALCRSFYNFYSTTTITEKSGCIAMADCSQIGGLADVMRRINAKGLNSYDVNNIQVYEGLSPGLFYDLGHYVEQVCGDAALLSEFREQMDRTFPASCRLHTPTFYTAYSRQHIPVTNYSGVSVSEPSSKYTSRNQQTAWYKATHL